MQNKEKIQAASSIELANFGLGDYNAATTLQSHLHTDEPIIAHINVNMQNIQRMQLWL